MAQLQTTIDPKEIDISGGSNQLPVGKHNVVCQGDELRETRTKDSFALILSLLIIDGPLEGTQGDYMLNLYNQNETTVRIAQEGLTKVMHVTGNFDPYDNTDIMHNKPFQIEIVKTKGKDDKVYHNVKNVWSAEGKTPLECLEIHMGGESSEPEEESKPKWGKKETAEQEKPATKPAVKTQAKSGAKPPWLAKK